MMGNVIVAGGSGDLIIVVIISGEERSYDGNVLV